MNCSNSKIQSSLKISNEVLSTISKNAIKDIGGVYSVSTLPLQYSDIKSPTASKSVRIQLNADAAQIDIAVILDMKHRLKDVCEKIQKAVKDSVQNMTSIPVSKVNVYVTGVNIKE